jgi:hypothetical protein
MGGQIEYKDILALNIKKISDTRRVHYFIRTVKFRSRFKRADEETVQQLADAVANSDTNALVKLCNSIVPPLKLLESHKLRLMGRCLQIVRYSRIPEFELRSEIKEKLKHAKIRYVDYYQRIFGSKQGIIEDRVYSGHREIEDPDDTGDLQLCDGFIKPSN